MRNWAAMFGIRCRCRIPMIVLRMAAMAWCARLTRLASSPRQTSRNGACRIGGAVFRRPPPQNRACHSSRHTAQAARGGGQASVLLVRALRFAVWVTPGAVGVYEAVFRPASVLFGDGLAGHRLPDGGVPGLPLAEGVGYVIGEQQQLPAQRALSGLVTQGVMPRRRQLRGLLLSPPVSPVLGQGRVVGRVPAGDR